MNVLEYTIYFTCQKELEIVLLFSTKNKHVRYNLIRTLKNTSHMMNKMDYAEVCKYFYKLLYKSVSKHFDAKNEKIYCTAYFMKYNVPNQLIYDCEFWPKIKLHLDCDNFITDQDGNTDYLISDSYNVDCCELLYSMHWYIKCKNMLPMCKGLFKDDFKYCDKVKELKPTLWLDKYDQFNFANLEHLIVNNNIKITSLKHLQNIYSLTIDDLYCDNIFDALNIQKLIELLEMPNIKLESLTLELQTLSVTNYDALLNFFDALSKNTTIIKFYFTVIISKQHLVINEQTILNIIDNNITLREVVLKMNGHYFDFSSNLLKKILENNTLKKISIPYKKISIDACDLYKWIEDNKDFPELYCKIKTDKTVSEKLIKRYGYDPRINSIVNGIECTFGHATILHTMFIMKYNHNYTKYTMSLEQRAELK